MKIIMMVVVTMTTTTIIIIIIKNEYQESFWGVKGGRRIRLTILPLTAICEPIV
jgi:hypothetical protein